MNFRLGSISIQILPIFWLFAILLGYLFSETFEGTFIWVLIILCSLLFHEMGHALTACAFGQNASIQLMAFGGVTQRDGPKLALWKEFLITLNGPLAGFLLAGLALFVTVKVKMPTPLFEILISLSYVNVFWTLINLLPLPPLDGGQLVRIISEAIFGFRGISYAYFFGFLFGCLLVAASLVNFNYPLLAALFALLTFENFRAWNLYRKMTPQDISEPLTSLFQEAMQLKEQGNPRHALTLLTQVRERSGKGQLHLAATQESAALLFEEGRTREALELLLPHKKELNSIGLKLLQEIYFSLKSWKEALEIGTALFVELPIPYLALLNARSCAHLEKTEEALSWLQSVKVELGPDLAAILNDSDFDSLRGNPTFEKLK